MSQEGSATSTPRALTTRRASKSLEKAKVYAGNLAARDRILNTISSVIIADSRIGDAVRQKYHEVALALGGTVEDADEQMERSVNRYL